MKIITDTSCAGPALIELFERWVLDLFDGLKTSLRLPVSKICLTKMPTIKFAQINTPSTMNMTK